MSLLARFTGDQGERRIRQSLLDARVVAGRPEIADRLCKVATIGHYACGSVLMEQGGTDTDIFFILAGSVSVRINGREVNTRGASQHVGEMALIDVTQRRSATVVATEETVVAQVTEPEFTAIASSFPDMWRQLALELGDRLRQRGSSVVQRNDVPRLFIGSSVEGLAVAQAVQQGLDHDRVIVTIWTDGVFQASRGAVDSLVATAKSSDFAVLVATPDDQITSRGEPGKAPRDNVVFELGLFVGALGQDRVLILRPRGLDLKLPTDLLGVAPLDYKPTAPGDLLAALGPTCTEIRKIITAKGPR